MTVLIEKVRAALPHIALRERQEQDIPFLSALYASAREEELRQVDWPDAQKKAFLLDQFTLQHEHYLKHYPHANWLLIEQDGTAIGRLYEETTGVELRLMDISLMPEYRNQGIGSALMNIVLAHADEIKRPVSLHVESFNPALHLYDRLGFRPVETRGIYYFMRREVIS